MADRIEVSWPAGGVSDAFAYDDQPPKTTSDAYNVRTTDPGAGASLAQGTGRLRGGQRPGRSKQNASQIAAGKIQDLLQVTYSQKTVDYSASASQGWVTSLPAGGSCLWGETDAEGNVYALNGAAGIVKYSATGAEIYRYAVPVPAGSTIRQFDVDEGTNLYCGVGGELDTNKWPTGDTRDARLWKLQHAFRGNDDENEPELEVAWTLTIDKGDDERVGPLLKGLVTFVRARNQRLYTLQQDPSQYRSWLVVYEGINSGVPFEGLVYEVPYPATAIDVNEQGEIAISTRDFGDKRGGNPLFPGNSEALVGWDPAKNIDDDIGASEREHRIWSHYKLESKYLVTTDGLEPEDGAEVILWQDASGNGRHLKFDSTNNKKPPVYREKGLAGKPALYFDGSTMLLATSESPTGQASYRDGQRGMFPSYKDQSDSDGSAMFAAFAMLRPEAIEGTTVAAQHPVWVTPATHTNNDDYEALIVNRGKDNGGANLDTLSDNANTLTGSASWYTEARGTKGGEQGEGSQTGRSPSWADGDLSPKPFTNSASAMLVSILACNGVDYGDGSSEGDDTETRSIFRLWGRTHDRFAQEADALASTGRQFLGGSPDTAFSNFSQYKGEVYELVVLDRRSLSAAGAAEPATARCCSHPKQPDERTTYGSNPVVGQVTVLDDSSINLHATDKNTTLNLVFTGTHGTTPAGTVTTGQHFIEDVTLTHAGVNVDPTVTATIAYNHGTSTQPTLRVGLDNLVADKVKTTFEKIEGYLAWKYGCSHLLAGDSGMPTTGFSQIPRINGDGTEGVYTFYYGHPYCDPGNLESWSADIGCPESSQTTKLHRFVHQGEILTLMDGNGKLLDVISHTHNGTGMGVRFAPDGDALYTAGNTVAGDGESGSGSLPASVASVRRWTLNSDTRALSEDTTGSWPAETGLWMEGPVCGIKVDEDENVYVPCAAPRDQADSFRSLVLKSDGTTIDEYSAASPAADNYETYCIALPRKLDKADLVPLTPDYEGDLTTPTCEHFYIFGSSSQYDGDPSSAAVQRRELVATAANANSPRAFHHVAVCNGGVHTFHGSATEVEASVFSATGYIQSTAAFQKGYLVGNGNVYKVYDPKDGTLVDWKAERGEIPERCKIVELWRGRMVMCGDGSGAVSLSRVSKPLDWDKSPPVPTTVQACDFATTEVGDVPDIVNGFCPYSDDVAVIFGDHTLWRLQGDPMRGGQLDLISDVTGGAFGRAWCKDAEGRIWFVGSRGGLWVLNTPFVQPQHVSLNRVEQRMQAIDFAEYYLRLEYDAEREGVWIMVLPYTTHAALAKSLPRETWFFETRTGAFWPDYVGSTGSNTSQVTAITVIDGDDPTDRRVLTGHEDGYVRFCDDAAVSDDSVAIAAQVRMGPLKHPRVGREMRTTRVGMTLGNDADGVTATLHVSDEPDVFPGASKTLTYAAGSNLAQGARVLGTYTWLKLVNSSASESFSFERAWLDVEGAGRERVR